MQQPSVTRVSLANMCSTFCMYIYNNLLSVGPHCYLVIDTRVF